MSESLIDASLYINSSTESHEELKPIKPTYYEKISESEDIYLIQTEDNSYELHRDRLTNTLKELHKYAHIKISQLNVKIESQMFNLESLNLIF